ncbi:hypothetical protein TVAG_273250 [Trichomonas vaginalis G3]|uniref:Uncharacterized protein n=1 Tax=Trichomonas vaginalis (strain ATCC PRA-98 / G3) TaxID=412133 RepID=A2EZV1_TRIV3|nr:hypothetical protein TVAGG3_0197320 [Trichomonas vaginalis G3]EAY01814.1 hypothetical protein TVAG_273250 [Trichomonas vaginalis G3]KAI5550385.1 hypothetical protein TVAGG3_0197320 [Trichomonas vaginalis G3]|eukprot:XP_001314361.1 hypothetical protein [Trichomonas vaginalis G3]
MGRFFNPSTISSIVRHFQGIGITLSPGWLKIPEKLQKFEDAIISFFDQLWEVIPRLKDFDVSVNFVFVTVMIPIILDLFLIWTAQDELLPNLIHLLDMVFAIAFGFQVGYLCFNTSRVKWETYFLIIISVLWFAIRIYRLIKKHRHSKPEIADIVEEIRKYYMKDILPGTESSLTEETLYDLCEQYDTSIMLEPIAPNWLNMIFLLIILAASLAAFLAGCGVYAKGKLNIFFKVVAAGIGLIVFLINLFVFIMIVIPCCRAPFIKVRLFVKKYSLYIYILCLDFLYIPVCNRFLDLFSFDDFSCPVGQYYPIRTNVTSYLTSLTTGFINFTCSPCSDPITGICSSLCDGSKRHYNILSPQITVNRDILGKAGPSVVYGCLCIIIGIPLCWIYLIHHNKSIMWRIPAFGESPLSKWFYLTNHLTTSGKNLFYMYTPKTCNWGILVMCSKFIFVIITMISERVNKKVIWASLGGYIILLLGNWFAQPYMRRFNNVLDTMIYGAQSLLTLVPICALFGKIVPNWFSIPLSIIISILPLFSILVVLICKPKAISGEEYDPWACYDEDGNKVEGIIEDRTLHVPQVHFMTIWQLQEFRSLKIQEMRMQNYDEAIIKAQEEDMEMEDPELGDSDVVEVSSLVLKEKITEMEAKIDQICDATSTKQLIIISNVVSLIGCLVMGYFFGSTFGEYILKNNYKCGI